MRRNNCKKFLFFLMFSILAFLYNNSTVYADEDSWTNIGPLGILVDHFTIDPNDEDNIWVASDVGLFHSVDNGTTWGQLEDLPLSNISDVVVSPDDSQVLFIVGQQGLYRSEDGGNTWGDNLNEEGAYTISISPFDTQIILTAKSFFDCDSLFRSEDGGDTWSEVNGVENLDIIREIVFAPSAPYIVYAGGFGGLIKSYDSGESWITANGNFVQPPMIYSVAVDPYDSDIVYIGTGENGIFRSDDGGDSWTPIGSSGLESNHIESIVIDSGNQQVIYAGGGPNPASGTPGVYRSLDSLGKSWERFMDGMGPKAIYDLFLDDSTPQNIYAGTSSGLWKYTIVSGTVDFSVSINNGDLFTNQTNVILNLSAPSGTSEMIVSNDGGFSGATWEPYADEREWTITSYGIGIIPRTVYVKFKRNGIISGLYQDDIILDTVAPTGTVRINTQASLSEFPLSINTFAKEDSIFLPLLMKKNYSGYIRVQLTLNATDDLSGVDEMIISADASFQDAEWCSYTGIKEFWLPEGDVLYVYVKYRDLAGNISKVYSDSTSD